MRTTQLCLLALAVLSLVPFASAANSMHGNVRMHGSIIDTPCAIAADSRDQSIDLSVIPVSTIISEGVSPSRPFTIQLINCSLETSQKNKNDWSKFAITFDGKTTNGNLFSADGEATGVGIQISDSAGNIAVPGQTMPERNIEAGQMKLDYSLRLMANRETVRAGTYQSTIRFKMDYY